MAKCSFVFYLSTVEYCSMLCLNSLQYAYIHNTITLFIQKQNKARTSQFSASTGGFILLRTVAMHNYFTASRLNIRQVHSEIPLQVYSLLHRLSQYKHISQSFCKVQTYIFFILVIFMNMFRQNLLFL